MGYRKRTVSKTGEITDEIPESVPEGVPESFGTARLARAEVSPELPEPEPEIDEATKRKQEIADKRRASLALARSKIVPKSALKKQADEVIKSKDVELKNKQEETDAMRLKYERDRVKQLEDSLMTLQKLIADKSSKSDSFYETKPAPVATPVVVVAEPPKRKRPSRSKEALAERAIEKHDVPVRQPQQIIPKKSVEPRMVAPPSTEKLIDKSYSEQLQERLRSQAVNKIMMDTFGGF